MKSKVIKYFIPFIKEQFNNSSKIIADSFLIFKDTCNKFENDSKKVKIQTEGNLFPIYAIYIALQNNNVSKEKALVFLDKYNYQRKLKDALLASKIFRLFGLYKTYPKIFKEVTLSSFGEELGFKPDFVIANKNRCKFNMMKCLYCQRCKELGVFELVPVFCHTDDAFNKNLHPNIIWRRSMTLAEGGKCCDFDIEVINNKTKK